MDNLHKPLRPLPYRFAKQHHVVIAEMSDGHWGVHYTNDTPLSALLEIKREYQDAFAFELIDKTDFENLLVKSYERDADSAQQLVDDFSGDIDLASLTEQLTKTEDLLETQDDAPIIRLINALLAQGIKENASDIHIETFEDHLVVRYRVDGVLRKVLEPQRALAPLLISRIKVMARLDISEKRLPQDGRISLRVAGHQVDVRVSTLPSAFGERVVLRLLTKQAGHLDLVHLGMTPKVLETTVKLIAKPHGILLVTGPTGAGKTTTLYAILSDLNDSSRNILTVEDPIEYDFPGIGQTAINTKIGLTFARGLRAILRQDPDVVMVGEIRDLETAQIAVQASLTGHLVLSTLHTNTAIGVVTRLFDMGVEPFLLSSSLNGMIAQRLVRVLCPHCRVKCKATDEEALLLGCGDERPEIYHAVGCKQCNGVGYWGRRGIYEVIAVDDNLRRMIHQCASEQEMEAYVRKFTPSLKSDGVMAVLSGLTTLEELLRVTTAG